MRIAVIGVGHVGLVSAAVFARWGHEVVGYDGDQARVDGLRRGELPFFEPDLDTLVHDEMEAGRLAFVDDLPAAIDGAAAAFVCVGTPALPGGAPNLSFVETVGREVVAAATGDIVLIEKSTVPADTGRRLGRIIEHEAVRLGSKHRIEVASNPEFLREGTAVQDTLHPDRIVYGVPNDRVRDILRRIYEPVVTAENSPVVETDVPTAELIKHASNAFLATRISFINAVAQICERVGADVDVVARGMGYDQRIGHAYLEAGLGYGGSCFPKDVEAFAHLAGELGYPFGLLEEVRRINADQREAVLRKLRTELWHLEGKTIVLLGAAFKPGTDDLRESPAIHLADELAKAGSTVRIYDPVALPNVRRLRPDVEPYDDLDDALSGAHAAVVCTAWEQVRELTPQRYVKHLAYPIVIDGRNVHEPDDMLEAGVRYHSMGRRSAD